jgi:hypothetical protein
MEPVLFTRYERYGLRRRTPAEHPLRLSGPLRHARSGGHSLWASELLAELGHEVIVAPVREVRALMGSHKQKRPSGCPQTGPLGTGRPGDPASGAAP